MRWRKLLFSLTATVLLAGTALTPGLAVECAITRVDIAFWESTDPVIDIYGKGFGSVRGTRNVQVDGALITSLPGCQILGWSDTMIEIHGIDIIPWEHVYQFAVTEGHSVISNVFSRKFPYKIEAINPVRGLPRTKVALTIWNLPATQSQYVVKLGKHVFPVLKWGFPLEVKVPAVPHGKYEVCLLKGSVLVSNKVEFTVLKPVVLPTDRIRKEGKIRP
jgi:hypothetical protein